MQLERRDGIEFFRIGPAREGASALVFLHEGLGCAAMWRDFPARLCAATGCGGLVYSRRGYGGSAPVELPRPLDYMEREGERELPALLEALGVTRPILFGHSDGASIALVAAATGLDPRALLLEAPHVFAEDVSLRSIAAAREAYEQGSLRSKLIRWHADNVDGAFWGWNRAWLDPAFRAWSLERYLPRITAPALLLQGLDDEYGTRAQLDAIAANSAGPVQLELLEKCGHAPHRDQSERTLELATRFVGALERE